VPIRAGRRGPGPAHAAAVAAQHRAVRPARRGYRDGQQVGGSIGLPVVGTVAWSAVAGSLRSQTADAAKAGLHVSAA
jgi:hypothetical protein